ncbi:MAG: 50S ribosomal protein L17 [Planctomycetes bacterium]|nr:50S ribosomal protein L17 [Planctomycetota bacterium]
MRHRVKGRTLGRSQSHRAAMLRNLVSSLILHESITTTEPRAKEARSLAEKLITLGKKGSLHDRRLALKRLHNKEAVAKIFDDIAKRSAERKGGYTRILKMDTTRLGDNASQVVFQLVDQAVAESEEVAQTEGAES